jgi:hypothetical protein
VHIGKLRSAQNMEIMIKEGRSEMSKRKGKKKNFYANLEGQNSVYNYILYFYLSKCDRNIYFCFIQKENRKVHIGKLRSAQNMEKVIKEGRSERVKKKRKKI